MQALITINIVLFFMIVVFRAQEVFSFIIVSLLGKNLSFTGRTEIWDLCFIMIKNSFLFGYGFSYERGLVYWRDTYTFGHNLILEILLLGGVLSLLLFLTVTTANLFKIKAIKNKTLHSLFCMCVFILFISGITEFSTGTYRFYFAVLAFAGNSEYFADMLGESETSKRISGIAL
jgi:O-antigen ligase